MLSSLPTLTLAAYWEDLIAEGGTQQGIYYQLDNVNSQPSVTFEYILANLGIQDEFFHFLVNYDSSNPGVIKVYYFVAGDSGLEATVGIQGTGANGTFGGYSLVGSAKNTNDCHPRTSSHPIFKQWKSPDRCRAGCHFRYKRRDSVSG